MDMETLAELHGRFPWFIPFVVELTAKLGEEDVVKAPSISAQSSPRGETGDKRG